VDRAMQAHSVQYQEVGRKESSLSGNRQLDGGGLRAKRSAGLDFRLELYFSVYSLEMVSFSWFIMLPDIDQSALYRILDANYNRAAEGIRTLEEIARFRANASSQQLELKSLRHQLAAAVQLLPAEQLLRSRCAAGDVGADNTLDSEQSRTSVEAIQRAAAQRVQQALRSLEEFSKPLNAEASLAFAKIRYAAYDLLARIQLQLLSHKISFQQAQLYLLVDLKRDARFWIDHLQRLVEAGVDILQIRDKQAEGAELLERCQQVVEKFEQTPVRIIINDRPDIALMSGADSVHLGQEDISVAVVRKWFGQRLTIGLSTHNLQQVKGAELAGVDYIGCGPTFPSTTKQFTAFSGLAFLKEAALSRLPAFAIGGITLELLPQVLATGFRRVAVAGDIERAEDPYHRVRTYRERLAPSRYVDTATTRSEE